MVNTKKSNALDRYYNIAKVLLALSPFAGLAYIAMSASQAGGDFAAAISQNPRFTVLFLVCMINPFIAYLLIFMHRKLKEGDISYAIINLVLLIIAEGMLQNLLYMILIGFLLFKTVRIYDSSIRESFALKKKEKLLSTISGSFVVLVLAGICLFAQIRIGL
ncbi:MAG: hypothetical protein ACI4E3_01565 [Candidatus Fimousia sp.]